MTTWWQHTHITSMMRKYKIVINGQKGNNKNINCIARLYFIALRRIAHNAQIVQWAFNDFIWNVMHLDIMCTMLWDRPNVCQKWNIKSNSTSNVLLPFINVWFKQSITYCNCIVNVNLIFCSLCQWNWSKLVVFFKHYKPPLNRNLVYSFTH